MALRASLLARLARLSLHARLWAVIFCLAMPMLAAALLAAGAHLYAVSAWQSFAGQEQQAAELSLKARAALPGWLEAGDQPAAMASLRAQMREIGLLSGEASVRRAAQAANKVSYDHEKPKDARSVEPADLEPLLDRLVSMAGDAAARAQARAETLGQVALAAMFLLPALATGIGILLARGLTHSIDGTLRDCIAFAGEIASGNFSHGSSHARGGTRTLRMDADADSASEFDILVRSMNRIADETGIAAKRGAETALRLERVERATELHLACRDALLHCPGETDLLNAYCGHLVKYGGYHAAWIGYARDDATRSIEVAGHGGSDGEFIKNLQLSWGDDVHQQGGFGTAIHQGRTLSTTQLAADLVFNCSGRLKPPHGLASATAIPLRMEADAAPFGVLGLYSGQNHSVDDDELELLQRLMDELIAGIVSRRSPAARSDAAAAHPINYDDLTGLAKFATLRQQLAPLAIQARDTHRKLGALHLNLDSFDVINDKLGREVGDQMLVQAALRLAQGADPGAVLARGETDEFVVLLPGIDSAAHAGKVAARIEAKLGEALEPGRLPSGTPPLKLSASIGISIYPDDSDKVEDLLLHAARAMQEAKQQGGNTYRYHAAELNARIASRAVMEGELGKALERGELLMHYQPQCSLQTGAITGGEALIRWQHPKKGMLAPQEFIRMAEETGLVLPIGAWAIETVCAQMAAWGAQGLKMPPVSINLSPRQFQQSGLVEVVNQALDRHRIEGRQIELEVTEAALMHDPEEALRTLQALHALGVRIALDDFGTGYSSLHHLKRFPIERLKIDQSFVHEIGVSPDAGDICKAVIGLAHSLKVAVVGESVETAEQLAYLRHLHCDAMQGHLFSKALAADGYAQLVGAGQKLALPAMPEGQRTVLLVDDEAASIRGMNRALKGEGYHILAATSAADALKLMEQNDVHVVLADQAMPGATGVQFLAEVQERYPAAVRLITAAYADLEPAISAMNQGIVHAITPKPASAPHLRYAIRTAFHRPPA